MSEELKMLPCPFCGNKQIDYWNEADGFYYCEKCGLCGPRAHDKILAAERWNGLPRREKLDLYQPLSFHPGEPRRLRWTKEKPTQEGWYWHRWGKGDFYNGGVMDMVYVYIDETGCPRYRNIKDYSWGLESRPGGNGLWAGPIPEPEEL